jgi:hypothetical protein
LPPLPRQRAEIADLAGTPPAHPNFDSRIAAAHNKAALIARTGSISPANPVFLERSSASSTPATA